MALTEAVGSPIRDHYDAQTGVHTATRVLHCPWSERYMYRSLFLRWPPQRYPYDLYFDSRAVSVTIDPLPEQAGTHTGSLISYQVAVLTVEYSTPTPGAPQPYPRDVDAVKHSLRSCAISESIEPISEAFLLKADLFMWASDSKVLDREESPFLPLSRARYTMTRHFMPNIPAAFYDLQGKCNIDAITPITKPLRGRTFGPKTLMLDSVSIHSVSGEGGEQLADINCNFLYKKEGWHRYLRQDTQDYDSIVYVATGNPWLIPKSADFSALFP